MSALTCTHRDHTIRATVMEHPGLPTPWAGGCQITDPDGKTSKRLTLPMDYAFMTDLDKAQRASIAHGKWLVDQKLDHGRHWH